MTKRLFLLGLLLGFLLPVQGWAWFGCEWLYRTTITVTENANQSLVDYPFLLELQSTDLHAGFDWSSGGDDLRMVASDDTTQLDFYIESWDSTNETARVWVILPALGQNGSLAIYLYYGNPAASPATSDASVLRSETGIKFHTRNTSTNPGSYQQAMSIFNSLGDQVAGYGCTFVNSFNNISNSGLFNPDRRDNFLAYSESIFYVAESEEGTWSFRYGADYGYGGGLYINGVTVDEDWNNDFWWGNSWNNSNEILDGSIYLSAGYHRLNIMGGEGCCDGGLVIQFQKPGGNYQTLGVSTLDIGSRACSVGPEPTWQASNIETTSMVPNPVIQRSTDVLDDPVNLSSQPKRIPNATIRINLSLMNAGTYIDDNTLSVTEAVPATLSALVGTTHIGINSNYGDLNFTYSGAQHSTDSVSFSDNNGVDFNYQPTPGAMGEDSNITHIKFDLDGRLGCMPADSEFGFYYDALIK